MYLVPVEWVVESQRQIVIGTKKWIHRVGHLMIVSKLDQGTSQDLAENRN